MKIIEKPEDFTHLPKNCVLSIGNFDGVHFGHQSILSRAKKAALERNTQLVVMTFEPHPVAVLYPEKLPGVLTPLDLKSRLLAEIGVDWMVVLKTTIQLLQLSAEAFVDRYLATTIRPSVVVEGHDFNFGYKRSGDLDALRKLGKNKGFEVCVVEAEKINLSDGRSVRVSSTAIRQLLNQGRILDANAALSRPYRLIGRIVRGYGRGKDLGFPTANLEPAGQIIPSQGVYAGRVLVADDRQKLLTTTQMVSAVFSIGTAPTLGSWTEQIEAHLLAENVPDLIGKAMAMDFIERIRDQQKFADEKELSAQIARDCEKAKHILADKSLQLRQNNLSQTLSKGPKNDG